MKSVFDVAVGVERGAMLPNGAMVVAVARDVSQEKFYDMRPQGVLLAVIPGAQFEPYVTWSFVLHEDGWLDTHAGHYFGNVLAASKDLARRAQLAGE